VTLGKLLGPLGPSSRILMTYANAIMPDSHSCFGGGKSGRVQEVAKEMRGY